MGGPLYIGTYQRKRNRTSILLTHDGSQDYRRDHGHGTDVPGLAGPAIHPAYVRQCYLIEHSANSGLPFPVEVVAAFTALVRRAFALHPEFLLSIQE